MSGRELDFLKTQRHTRCWEMKRTENQNMAQGGGLAGWLLGKLRSGSHPRPRLELLERITLAPRQSLALIEAEGRRLLVATSPEGAPAFYALDEQTQPGGTRRSASARPLARVSW